MNDRNLQDTPVLKADPASPAFLLAEAAAWFALQKQADDVVILDLRGRSDVCDFFVIGTGAADVQIRAIAREVRSRIESAGHGLINFEDSGRWMLLDFFDVVVHVFHPDGRAHYQLEKLWGDAPRLEIPFGHFDADEVRARHGDIDFPPHAQSAATEKETDES